MTQKLLTPYVQLSEWLDLVWFYWRLHPLIRDPFPYIHCFYRYRHLFSFNSSYSLFLYVDGSFRWDPQCWSPYLQGFVIGKTRYVICLNVKSHLIIFLFLLVLPPSSNSSFFHGLGCLGFSFHSLEIFFSFDPIMLHRQNMCSTDKDGNTYGVYQKIWWMFA